MLLGSKHTTVCPDSVSLLDSMLFSSSPSSPLRPLLGSRAQHAWYPQWSWRPGEEVAAQGVWGRQASGGRAVRWGWLGSCGHGGTGEPTSPIYTFALQQVS